MIDKILWHIDALKQSDSVKEFFICLIDCIKIELKIYKL